jgi:hypothetical protein
MEDQTIAINKKKWKISDRAGGPVLLQPPRNSTVLEAAERHEQEGRMPKAT